MILFLGKVCAIALLADMILLMAVLMEESFSRRPFVQGHRAVATIALIIGAIFAVGSLLLLAAGVEP